MSEMGLGACLEGLIATGKMSREQAREVSDLSGVLQKQYAENLTGPMAEKMATEQTIKIMADKKILARRQKSLQALVTHKNMSDIMSHPKGAVAGAMSKMTKDTWGKAGYSNLEFRINHWQGILHGKLTTALDAYRSKYAGVRQDKVGIRRFVRELYGESTGDKIASASAKAWDETTELARQAANAAGANIKKRSDWFLPNHHDARRIRKAGKADWLKKVQALDIEIRDLDTGVVLSARERDKALAGIWETLSSDGMNKLTPGVTGASKLANRLGGSRILQFKDAESWLSYNDSFGSGNIYDLLTGHIHGISRDISMMEILGPNPDAMVQHMVDLAKKDRVMKGKEQGIGPSMVSATYGHLSGKLGSPVSELVARAFGGTRNFLSIAQLGKAPISALSDMKFLQQTASWNGMSSVKVLKRHKSLLRPGNSEDRAFAVRQGLIADAWVSKSLAAKRFQDEIVGDGWTSHAANSFHRLSGLVPMTQAGRHAFGLEFFAFLADHAGTKFSDLPDSLTNSFKRYGVNESLWDVARKADLEDYKGARFMRTENIITSNDPLAKEAGQRIHEMVLEETDFAIPTPDARTRMIAAGNSQRGTFGGEIRRSTMMYKSFAISIMHTHLMRGALAGDGGRYLASLITGLTVMGAGVIALKDIANGRDPRDMTTPEFWGQAFLQGGGVGIFGDFLGASLSRKKGTLVETAAGPMFGLASDGVRLLSGNVRKFYNGDETSFVTELLRFGKQYSPLRTWYTSQAFDRLIWDQLQKQADPDYAKAFARMRKSARKNYGSQYWWEPGDIKPDRSPDLNNATAQ